MKTVGVLNLPDELAQWEPHVTAASQAHGVPESLIYAVMSRESRGGLALRELCGDWTARVGHWLAMPNVVLVQNLPDGWKPPRDSAGFILKPPYAIPEDKLGWGRGLMQLDYEAAMELADWSDPMENIDQGAKLLRALVDEFPRNLRAAVAAYNCGAKRVREAVILFGPDGVDHFTTGHDYSADVLRRQKSFLQEPTL